MNQAIEKQIQETKQKTINALLSIGFSPENAEKQISELGSVITMSIMKKIIEENPDQMLDDNNIQEFIKSKYTNEDIGKIVTEESGIVFMDYFKEVTKNLSDEEKQRFFDQLK